MIWSNHLEVDSLLDAMELGVVVHEPDTSILQANARALELLGISLDQALGVHSTDPGWDFVNEHGDSLPVEKYPVSLAASSDDALHNYKLGVVKDPSSAITWLNCNAYQRTEDKRIVVTFIDVTSEVEARNSLSHALHEAEDSRRALSTTASRLELALSAISAHTFDFDISSGQITFDENFAALLGYRVSELPEINLERLREMTHLDDVARRSASLKAVINGETEYYQNIARLKHKAGHWIWVENRGKVSGRDSEGRATSMVGVLFDVTKQKQSEQALKYEATHDSLTGLINRQEFERRAKRLMDNFEEGGSEHALCFIDLDNFKVVNDTCGHVAGDELLRQISHALRSVVRRRDSFARLGGDEFAVLMEHCDAEQAKRVAKKILETVQQHLFSWGGHTFRVGCSIGLVNIASGISNFQELLRLADTACYAAKDLGRNRVHVYAPEDKDLAQMHGQMLWVNRIHKALDSNLFQLFAQSIVAVGSGKALSSEILIRMRDSNGDTIPPSAFLPAAERYNLAKEIDRWVVSNTLDVLATNPAALSHMQHLSINLSGLSVADNDFMKFLIDAIERSKVPGERLCFEVTETAAIQNLAHAIEFITQLKALGCKFALDDFGSGLSSFGYLKALPVDFLKIDGMFVKDMVADRIDRAMVKSINELAHELGMRTIAEFVENDEIIALLDQIGVDYAQGYGVGRPQPLDELIKQGKA